MLSKEEFDRQYAAVLSETGWYDRSNTGRIAVLGEDRFSWLQGMVSNDVMLLKQPELFSIEACLLDSTGHILSDMEIVRSDAQTYGKLFIQRKPPLVDFLLLNLPRENVTKVMEILDRYIIMEDVALCDVTDNFGCVSVRGKNVYFEPNTPESLVALINGGRLIEISPEVQEVWRVKNGIPKWGLELDPTVIASEAVGKSHISLTKGCYVGQEIIARIDARGHTNRALTGMIVTSEVLPQFGDKLFAEEDGRQRETGRITSVVPYSPVANGKPIALGYVRHEHRNPGDKVVTQGENGQAVLTVTQLPFRKSAA